MAIGITIDWSTYVIEIPRTGMTLIQTTPLEIRQLDINEFRLELKDIEDSIEGMPQPDTHSHNTEVSLGGITYARVVEILDPYSLTFEDGQYAVNLVGANSNLGDKINVNQVSVRSNNSAGLISSPDIQYASFNGGVTINTITGFAGTAFPIGTERKKSNNLLDAKLIADFRGLTKYYIDSDLTLDDDAVGLDGFIFQGDSHIYTNLIVESGASTLGSRFTQVRLSGVLNGNNEIDDCSIFDVNYFNGHIHDSLLEGTLTLGGGEPTYIGNSSQVEYETIPIINMGGWGQNLVMTDYTGLLMITNLTGDTGSTGTTKIGIGLDHGQIILDSTSVTDGLIWVSGIGSLVDENGNAILSGTWNGGVTVINQLINKDTMTEASQLGLAIYVDTGTTFTGTNFPVGSKRTPVNNLDDAIAIAEFEGINEIIFLSNYFFPDGTNIENLTLTGLGYLDTQFTFETTTGGCVVSNCIFKKAKLTGSFSGVQTIENCLLYNLGSVGLIPASQDILIKNSLIDGVISLPSNYSGKLTVIDSYSNVVGAATPTLNFNGNTANMQVRNYTGGIKLSGVTEGNVFSIDLISGQVKLDPASVTGATIVVRGAGKVINADTNDIIYSGVWNGGVTVLSEANTPIQTAKQVWDENLAEHVDSGTTGLVLAINQFNGAVTINQAAGSSGTAFPIGTERVPVNNLADAKIIGQRYGFDVLNIDSSFVIASGESVNGYTISSKNHSTVEVQSGASTFYTNFTDVDLKGVLNGYSIITRGSINSAGLSGFYGIMEDTVQNGTLTISSDNTKNAILIDHTTGNVAGPPEINLNGDGAKLSLRGLTGAAKFTNKTGSTQGSFIDLYSARVGFDSTVTAGAFTVRGVGYIYLDDSTNTTFDTTGLISKNTVADAVWGEQLSAHTITGSTAEALAQAALGGTGTTVNVQEIVDGVWNAQLSGYTTSGSTGEALSYIKYHDKVHIDTVNGYSGTNYPIGTGSYPVNNLADAKTIATQIGTLKLSFDSDYTVVSGESVSGYVITSDNHSTIILESGAITMYTNFEWVNLAGELFGYTIINDCSISSSGITGFYGTMDRVVFNGNLTISSDNTKNAVLIDCFSGNVPAPPTFDCGGDGAKISLRGLTGVFLFTNKTGDSQKMFIDLYSARVGFDSTVTAGEITIRGVGYIYQDDSTNTTFDTQGLMSKATISVAVWDEELTKTTHNLPNSAGRRLRALSSVVIYEDDVVSGTTNTVTLQGASAIDGAYDPALIAITDGTGAGQSRLILEYNGATQTAVVDRDWKVIPDDTSVYVIRADAGREHVNEGLAQSGGTNTITLNALASSYDGVYVGQIVFIRSGQGEDQALRVTAYNGTTKVATVCEDWKEIPDNTSAYVMLPTSILKANQLADAIWNTQLSGHTISGSTGEALGAAASGGTLNVDAIVDGVWNAQLSGYTTSGSSGAGLSLASSGSTANVQEIADAVWDTQLSGHTASGSAGATLSGSTAEEVWRYPLPE